MNIEKVILSARYRSKKNGSRNAAMISIMYRCRLSINQLLSLRWDQVDDKLGLLYITRISKNNYEIIYPLFSKELKAIKEIKYLNQNSQYVFFSSNKKLISRSSFKKILNDAILNSGVNISVSDILNTYKKRNIQIGDNYIHANL